MVPPNRSGSTDLLYPDNAGIYIYRLSFEDPVNCDDNRKVKLNKSSRPKKCPKKFCKILRKTPVPESPF